MRCVEATSANAPEAERSAERQMKAKANDAAQRRVGVNAIGRVQTDVDRVSEGQWPLFAPWLHTYALPVFAVLAVVLALGWGAVCRWLADVDEYVATTLACAWRVLRSAARPARRVRPDDDHGPRRLFGLAFESRPPPLAA